MLRILVLVGVTCYVQATTLNDTLELKFWDGTLLPATVSVISNNDFPATCTSPVTKLQTVKWTKDGDPKFSVAGDALNLAEVNLGHEGVYTCTATNSNGETASRSFTLHVLYKPARPVVTGNTTTVAGVPVKLTCSSDSNPPASLHWTYTDDPSAPVEVRGPHFTVEHDKPVNQLKVYCWASVTLTPSKGSPEPYSISGEFSITVQGQTTITFMPYDTNYNAGDTIDVLCRADGVPAPALWWSKSREEDFLRLESRLVLTNVQPNDSGLYICHSENFVTNPITGTKNRTYDSRYVKLMVYAIERGNSSTCTCTCQDECGTAGLVVAIVIGWLLVIILLVFCVFIFIRARTLRDEVLDLKSTNSDCATLSTCTCRSESKPSKKCSCGASSNDNSSQPTKHRPLPIPYNIPDETDKREHSYLELDSKGLDPDDPYSYAYGGRSGDKAAQQQLTPGTSVDEDATEVKQTTETKQVNAQNDYLTPSSKAFPGPEMSKLGYPSATDI